MNKQTWLLLTLGFVFSCLILCALFALEATGTTHMLDNSSPPPLMPADAMARQAGQCLIPAALGVTGILGVGMVIGVIAEAAKRL